jgi:hypothetical protein
MIEGFRSRSARKLLWARGRDRRRVMGGAALQRCWFLFPSSQYALLADSSYSGSSYFCYSFFENRLVGSVKLLTGAEEQGVSPRQRG